MLPAPVAWSMIFRYRAHPLKPWPETNYGRMFETEIGESPVRTGLD